MLHLDRQNQLRDQLRDLRPGWQPATEQFADLVRAHLKPEHQVLDLGCGRGGLIEQLAAQSTPPLYPLAQTVGIDPDVISLQTHRLAPQFQRTNALYPLPFHANCFDLIYASWVLEHWERPERNLAEIRRVLKPGGLFIAITPNVNHPLLWANQALAWARLQGALVRRIYGRIEADTFPIYYRANSPAALHALAHSTQLELHTLHQIADPTYLALTPALFALSVHAQSLLPLPGIHLVIAFCRA